MSERLAAIIDALGEPYYTDGKRFVYCGDSRELLTKIEPGLVDLVLTDPPYGVAFKGKNTKHTKREDDAYAEYDDAVTVGPEVVRAALAICSRAIVTPGIAAAFRYPEPADIGCVYCPSGAGLGKWGFVLMHPVLYYGKCPYLASGMGHRPNSIQSFATQPPNGHPCPKPLEWMRWMLKKGSVEPADIVLDPFLGSGTTAVACKTDDRAFIGIELSEEYCEIAANRLRQGVLEFA